MAKNSTQTILISAAGLPESSNANELLAEVARAITSLAGSWDNGQVAAQLKELNTVSQTQSAAVSENTQAVVDNTVAHATTGGSTLSSVGSTVWKVFSSGLGLSPIISGLIGLFGGGHEETPPPLPVYTRPPAIQFEGALENPGTTQRAILPQITVQVQAMDSRSFLDHSDEIAQAVRQAMLNSHSLNDVVSELS